MEKDMLDREKDYLVKALSKGLTILEIFDSANTEYSVQEISKKLKINRTTAFRLVKTLAAKGFLEENNSKYQLGLKLLELGNLVNYNMDLRQNASPLLAKLAQKLSLTVHLVVKEGNEAIYIDKEDPLDAVITYSRVGKRLPLYCTAVGKVLLCDLSSDEIKQVFLGVEFSRFTANTITSVDSLTSEIKLAKESGYASDNEELQEGMICIAAPVRNHRNEVIAACSVTGIDKQFSNLDQDKVIHELLDTANKISGRMGWQG